MAFFLVFGIVLLLPGIFFTVLAIQSSNPKNLISTTGALSHHKGFKNYRLKNRTVPNATEYAYTYTVNGKSYLLRGVQHTHGRNLRKRVDIIYLRSFPRCAYERHFSGIAEKLLAVSLTMMGFFCVLLYIVVV